MRFHKFAQGEITYADGSAERSALFFNNFVPVPEALRMQRGWTYPLDPQERAFHDCLHAELTAEYGYATATDFRRAKWGTKWQPDDVAVTEVICGFVYEFATAWTPPAPLVVAASRQFPTLQFIFTYSEYMCGYRGGFLYNAGEITGHFHEHWDAFAECDEP